MWCNHQLLFPTFSPDCTAPLDLPAKSKKHIGKPENRNNGTTSLNQLTVITDDIICNYTFQHIENDMAMLELDYSNPAPHSKHLLEGAFLRHRGTRGSTPGSKGFGTGEHLPYHRQVFLWFVRWSSCLPEVPLKTLCIRIRRSRHTLRGALSIKFIPLHLSNSTLRIENLNRRQVPNSKQSNESSGNKGCFYCYSYKTAPRIPIISKRILFISNKCIYL